MPFRMNATTIRNMRVRNDRGEMVPAQRGRKDRRHHRAGGHSAIQHVPGGSGKRQPSTLGRVLAPESQLISQTADRSLSSQAGYEWTDISSYRTSEGSTAIYAFIGAVMLVYLVLAGLYNSWSPLPAIIWWCRRACCRQSAGSTRSTLLVPRADSRGDQHLYAQIGFVVLVGLACKNAILIVEFAGAAAEEGKSLLDATLEAVRLRLRPIVMTSFAFILGSTTGRWRRGRVGDAANAWYRGVCRNVRRDVLRHLPDAGLLLPDRTLARWRRNRQAAHGPPNAARRRRSEPRDSTGVTRTLVWVAGSGGFTTLQ